LQQLPQPHPHDGPGLHFLHLHLGAQGFGGHLRSGQDRGASHPHLPHPQHPAAERSAAAPSPKAAAISPSATGLKNSFVIVVLLI